MMAQGKETILNDDDFILSETDAKGRIVLVNSDFIRISEYEQDELIGRPHNMIRHKDMPKAAFADLWATIQKGDVWTGFVKNITKSGGFYWVYATVTPFTSCDGSKGYLSCRKKASREEIEEIEALYKTMD